MRTINANNLLAVEGSNVWVVDFVKITIDPNDSDQIVRLTTHSQNITFGGIEYFAAGQFLGFSSISDDLDTKDNSITVSVSGIDNTFTAVFLDSTNNLEGSPVELHRGYFNSATGEMVATPELRWAGFVSSYRIKDQHNSNQDDTVIWSVNCRSLLTTVLGRKSGRYTSTTGISDNSMDFVVSLKNFTPSFGKE